MRAIVRTMAAAAMLAALLVPKEAHALLNAQCGNNYSRTTSCLFTLVGANLSIGGHTSSPDIRVRVSDITGVVTIFECVGQFACNGSFGIPGTGTDSVGPPQGVGPLVCTVITNGSGYYRCQSNV